MTLGNHTFSHVDFNDTSLQQYEDEAIRGEVVTRQLLQERGLSKFYFRYPYNHTGATKERKEAFQRFLKSRGYEVAPFTVQHDDYLFSNVYEEAKRKNDKVLAKHIHTVYLEHLDTMFDYFEQRSRLLLGREVKQVFLIHATALNADCLEEMIGKLKQRGYYFISLEEALRDEAYQIQDDYVGKYGISWLHRWMISLGKELNYRDEPEPPKFVLDLQQAK
jgi:peptidoglycan/xylan/chitin deacetylase (PgdA/CDA1 family)